MSNQKLTPEEIQAAKEQAAAEKEAKAAARAAEKEAKAQAAAEAKAQKEAERAAKLAEKEAAKQAKVEEAEAKRAAKEAAKAEREAQREAKKAEKEAAKLARVTDREPEQNGMRRPKPGTKTRAIWDLCDQLSTELQRPVAIAELRDAVPEGTNENMMRSQYAYWRKFFGITGRVEAPKDETEVASEEA